MRLKPLRNRIFNYLSFFLYSGKGFYGRPLSEAWGVPLWTASTLLRASEKAQHLLDSGRLVDCQLVSHTIVNFLHEQQQQTMAKSTFSAFVMDGFPRTRHQIDLMEKEWPSQWHVSHAVLLDVPQAVSIAKIGGRRFCGKCQRHYNTAGYFEGKFDLPPILPATIPCDYDTSCHPETHWQVRADDVDAGIVRQRLQEHQQHEQPIIDYYEARGRLLRYTPYHGSRDLDDMRQTIERWMQETSDDS